MRTSTSDTCDCNVPLRVAAVTHTSLDDASVRLVTLADAVSPAATSIAPETRPSRPNVPTGPFVPSRTSAEVGTVRTAPVAGSRTANPTGTARKYATASTSTRN